MKSHYIIGIVCLGLILAGCGGYFFVTAQYNSAYQTLVTADGFYYAGIGMTGDVPNEARAFKKLYFSQNAREYFLRLADEGTEAGKLYALCGLYHLDKQTFATLIEEYQHITTPIPGGAGCIPTRLPMNQIISATDSPEYDIKHGKIPDELLSFIGYIDNIDRIKKQ